MIKFQLYLSLFLLSVILFFSSCSKTVYTSSWQSNDFTVLRKSETGQPLRFYDIKSKLQYSISNDTKNIYLCVKVIDEQLQSKILLAGMQVNIDTMGKKVQPIGILYPIGIEKKPKNQSGIKPTNDKDSKDNPLKTQFLLEQKEMQLSGFKSPLNGIITATYGFLTHFLLYIFVL